MTRMALFLRAVEFPDGNWECRQGNRVLDRHPTFQDAVAHLSEFARELGAEVLIIAHRLNGHIDHVRRVAPEP